MSVSRFFQRCSLPVRCYSTSRFLSTAPSTSSASILSTNLSSTSPHHTEEDDHHYANNIAHAVDCTQKHKEMLMKPKKGEFEGSQEMNSPNAPSSASMLDYDNTSNEDASHRHANVARAASSGATGSAQPVRTFMTHRQK